MSALSPTAMKVVREDPNPCTIVLRVECSEDQVRAGFDKAFKQAAKRVKVPGFRPGQAPRSMVEGLVAPELVAELATEEIVRGAFQEALKQEGIQPHSRSRIDDVEIDRATNSCTFVAKVPLAPIVELGNVTTLTVERPVVEVSDQDVDDIINRLREQHGKRETVTGRSVQEGDVAVINIRPEGDEGEGRNFMVIAGQTFPDLDKTLLGMSAEEIKVAKLSFPANFQEADWAGQTLTGSVTLRSLSAMKLPELDDEFAAKLEAKDMGALRERVRDGLVAFRSQSAQDAVNERLLDQLVQASTVHVADPTWESVYERRMADMAAEAQRRKVTLEQFAREFGMSPDEFQEAQRREAKLHVVRAVVVEHLFREHKMKITDADAAQHFTEIARENEVPADGLAKFSKEYGSQIREEVVYRAMFAQVLRYLNEQATVVEPGSTEAPKGKKGKKSSQGT